ncbi:hypothetical protein OA183_01035, partial [Flavobacteriales bacterium]|nr:hypothetical protein [Flavobacteriales bacterium]
KKDGSTFLCLENKKPRIEKGIKLRRVIRIILNHEGVKLNHAPLKKFEIKTSIIIVVKINLLFD